ncbi:YceI family protein [Paenibacillus sp. IB182496]|uniref:YceI family protein n=1 Tax=Paenibacillus sabuli TaxID=2772509 RepID=A0A927GTB2_9BACL|nr:YceI family protein [Paenibacillus sabuli]MBD2846915.1 YceI family protein [Paenibacillus sabuli]
MTVQKWAVDAGHSSVDFSIKHMMIARVKGTFHTFEADIEANPEDLTTASIEFRVDLGSIDTRNADRDNHLRSGDFFNVEKNPQMVFTAKQIVSTGSGDYRVTGDLLLNGLTRTETFVVTYEGSGKDPWGNDKVGFSAKGAILRSDYGLTYNSALETGGVLIGDEVKIAIELEAAASA